MSFGMITSGSRRRIAARNASEASGRDCGRVAVLLSLLLTTSVPLYGQTEEQKSIPRTTVYLMFLHYQASDAKGRESAGEQTFAVDKATFMGIKPQDIVALDAAAQAFVAQEKALAEEAITYQRERKEAGQPVDRATLHTFATRRESLILAALSAIRAQLSAGSFEAFERFLDTQFRKSLRQAKVR